MRHLSMKADRQTHRDALSLRLSSLVLLGCLLTNTLQCNASTFLLVNSGNGGIYNQFRTHLSTLLKDIDPSNTLNTLTSKDLDSRAHTNTLTQYDFIITAGIEASIAISRTDTNSRIIMAMLPKQSYQKLSTNGELVCKAKNCHVILLDQPIARQLRLIKLAFPERKHIAIISSKNSSTLVKNIRHSAFNFGLTINNIAISDKDSLLAALNQQLSTSEVLMAIPDPMVYNRNTARAILLSTFNQGIPLFAYSRSFVLAGATLGIYSTPKQIAQHVASLVTSPSRLASQPHILYPKYFSVDVNRRAADALHISIPATRLLAQRLKAYDKK